jgi:hypothetical protein
LSVQPHNLGIYSLFGGESGFFIPAFDQVFDLMLNDFLLRLRLPAFAYLVFIVHKFILLHASGLAAVAQFKPKLIKSADEKVGGRTARFIHTEAENGDVVRAKFFVTKNRIYFIYGSVKKGAPHGINHENNFEKPVMAFLNSFQLKYRIENKNSAMLAKLHSWFGREH